MFFKLKHVVELPCTIQPISPVLKPLAYLPRLPFQRPYVQSSLQAVLRPYGYFVVVLALLAGEIRTIIIHFINDQPIINQLLKTAQVLSRRPCHMASISVCFVDLF